MIAALLLAVPLQAPAAPAAAPREPLARPVVIGASFAAGFGVGRTFGAALAASCAGEERDEPVDLGDALFFLSPLATGKRQVAAALEEEPTLVVALDFLFWFGYGALDAEGGPIEAEEERLALLETGLALLEELECPLVVGDFPDMSAAVGGMLMPSQMPERATLERLTARVRAWGAGRADTLVIPLAELVRALGSKDEVRIGRHVYPAGTRLLQADRLHPTLEGLIAMAQLVCAELVRAELAPEEAFRFELEAVRKRLVPR
ncbi:MAG TPA: hypothetical protein VF530_13790 [Planctomycetota bacterium]